MLQYKYQSYQDSLEFISWHTNLIIHKWRTVTELKFKISGSQRHAHICTHTHTHVQELIIYSQKPNPICNEETQKQSISTYYKSVKDQWNLA